MRIATAVDMHSKIVMKMGGDEWEGLEYSKGKGKGLPQQSEMVQGVPGRLRPRIFLTFGTTRVVGRQP
jgi:hypothetical protein